MSSVAATIHSARNMHGKEHVHDHKAHYPLAGDAVNNNCYMDVPYAVAQNTWRGRRGSATALRTWRQSWISYTKVDFPETGINRWHSRNCSSSAEMEGNEQPEALILEHSVNKLSFLDNQCKSIWETWFRKSKPWDTKWSKNLKVWRRPCDEEKSLEAA